MLVLSQVYSLPFFFRPLHQPHAARVRSSSKVSNTSSQKKRQPVPVDRILLRMPLAAKGKHQAGTRALLTWGRFFDNVRHCLGPPSRHRPAARLRRKCAICAWVRLA